MEGDDEEPKDIAMARTAQKGGSCTKECLDAYYFDEEVRAANSVSAGIRNYKATQARLKTEQINLLMKDTVARIKTGSITEQELVQVVHSITKVENYWTRHGFKVLDFENQGLEVKAYFDLHKQVRGLRDKFARKVLPHLQAEQ